MRFFAITKAGLIAIALAVFTLWTCIVMERVTVKRANLEARRTLERLERLRRPAVSAPAEGPAALPFAPSSAPSRPTAG